MGQELLVNFSCVWHARSVRQPRGNDELSLQGDVQGALRAEQQDFNPKHLLNAGSHATGADCCGHA